MKHFDNLDMRNNEIVNAKFEMVSTLPSTNLFNGRIVFNESDNMCYIYKSNKWVSLADSDIIGDISTILSSVVDVEVT